MMGHAGHGRWVGTVIATLALRRLFPPFHVPLQKKKRLKKRGLSKCIGGIAIDKRDKSGNNIIIEKVIIRNGGRLSKSWRLRYIDMID